jgi:hypothetical protein
MQSSDFRAALLLGRLHVCCNCSAFTFGTEPAGVGRCERFDVEAWPFVPFWCSAFQPHGSPDYTGLHGKPGCRQL